MSKEIKVAVDGSHVGAFTKAVNKTPEIDFRNFSPHLALRCRMSEELVKSEAVRVSASINGGPLGIRINGKEVEGVSLSERELGSVIEVFCPGRGKHLTSKMLARGAVLVLKTS